MIEIVGVDCATGGIVPASPSLAVPSHLSPSNLAPYSSLMEAAYRPLNVERIQTASRIEDSGRFGKLLPLSVLGIPVQHPVVKKTVRKKSFKRLRR